MTGFRAPARGLIDRNRILSFRFDGRAYYGCAGDTVVSALLANGVRVMGRSFKYHRPRGAWSSWFDDPNAVFAIRLNGHELPNCPGATTELQDGMEVRSVNAFPSARFDLKSALDLGHRFLPAGFYYKTFMWPDWHLFEPTIRRMAGLGKLEMSEIDGYVSDQTHDACDLLVVGGGPSGIAAARAAAERGMSVVLVEDHDALGGSGLQVARIEDRDMAVWMREQIAAFQAAGGQILSRTTAFGVYDHQLVALIQQRGFGRGPRLIRMRAQRCVLAAGALDRPVTFGNNDRPGVMSLAGACDLLARYGVLAGQRIAVMAPHSQAAAQIEMLRDAGATMTEVAPDGPARALGGKRLRGLRVGDQTYGCDTILTSAGMMPVLHLWRHAGGKLSWDSTASAFVPASGPDWMTAVGGANGTFDLADALIEARAVAVGDDRPKRLCAYQAHPPEVVLTDKSRQWVDFQNDVTVKDIEIAARENYVSVEHLKRYTTLGMATDQGKTSNIPGLSTMASLRGKSIPETGTTTFRPPFVPVPLELYRGAHRGQQFHPLKRLCLEHRHRAAGAALGEYGGWLRPGWYGGDTPQDAIQREIAMVRHSAGVMDASPLGKIEVMGPDAEQFVNFIYYNTIATLKPGFIRYGFMLTEGGIVYDDGVIARIDQNRFVISCSSSHVEGVSAMLEAWRQDGNDPDRIFVHDTTLNWPTITVTGPKARDILRRLDLGVDLSPDAFGHMQMREGRFQAAPARIARVSFTGEVSYEISVPVAQAQALWDAALEVGAEHGAGPLGLEAVSVMRAEKGYVIIGKDTDGETMPHDLGFSIPRLKKKAAFVGDRALHTENATRPDRRRFVGLKVPDGDPMLPVSAHIVTRGQGGPSSCGYVSSSYLSPTLGHPIALAHLDQTQATEGTEVELLHLGQTRRAIVTAPCFFDPKGERLHA